MNLMNKAVGILGLVMCVSTTICGEVPPSILAVTATNAPSTWEGVFRFRDIHPVTLEGNETAFLAIYTNSNIKASGFEAALYGVVIDLLENRNGQTVRLLSAGANNWGSAPHILAFGDILPAANRYWSIWRVPGNGAILVYEKYAYTNGVMVRSDECVLDGKPDFRWYRENGLWEPRTEIPPLDFSNHNIIWLNTNTLYKLEAYNFNFPGNL